MRVVRNVVVVLMALALSVACAPQPDPGDDAESAVRYFLDRYVQPDGRVVRPDQGGTTVSEGQAYALLMAQAIGDEAEVRRIWRWTRENLRRPDGLLSYLADGERVLDPQAAADADVLLAYGLTRSESQDLRRDGQALASAVLRVETVDDGSGPVIVAGPWARESRVVNPSYWALPVLRRLGDLHPDPRWPATAERASALLESAAGGEGAVRLPPDWAVLRDSGLQPIGSPSGGGEPSYGLDAQRVLVFTAADCDPASRRLAARWWELLAREEASGALRLSLTGEVVDGQTNPLPLVASAAAADAAGDGAARDRLLAEATAQEVAHPTYYGAAWLALGRLLLQTDLLVSCEDPSP